MPKISVLLPVYNGERFLAQAIESVLGQTLHDFELLIADDASTDGSADIIAKYAAKDKRIVAWRNPEKKGLFANYNECMSRASGKYIKPFAQDDLFEREALEWMAKVLDNNERVSLVTCAKRWVDAEGKTLQEFKQFPEDRIIRGKDVILFNLIRMTNWVGEPVTAMFRRECMGTGFDEAFYHYGDIEYWFRIVKDGSYAYLNNVLCAFRRHEGSQTTKNLVGMLAVLDVMRMWGLYKYVLFELGESEAHQANRIAEMLSMQIDHLIRNDKINIADVLAVPLPESEHADCDALFADPREKLFWTLRELTEVLAELDDLKCGSAAAREHLQNQINNVKYSSSWKITGPFRYMVKVGRGQVRRSKKSEKLIQNSRLRRQAIKSQLRAAESRPRPSANLKTQGFAKAHFYARRYLDEKMAELETARASWIAERQSMRSELQNLTNSTSWKISKPLRELTKMIGGRA